MNAIDSRMPTLRASFDRFAPLLAKFKNLRNDCNYEALLVAHEVNHFTVTRGFDILVEAAQEASRSAVDLATSAYLANLRSDPRLTASREQFHAAHTLYVDGRLASSLRTKFASSVDAMDELRRVIESLRWADTPEVPDIEDEFLSPIMYDAFGAKRSLMERWQDDIDELQAALPHQ